MTEIIVGHIGLSGDNRKDNMNTVDKIVNEIAQKLANSIVEASNYKVLYEEAQAQLEQAQARLNEVSQTLEADEALKELFDEVANTQKGE